MGQSRAIIPMSDDAERITAQDVAPTVLPDDFLESGAARALAEFSLPRYHDLPDIELYRDQVIGYVEQAFSPLDGMTGDPWLTPAMVNNYVKAGLLPAPVKKRYGRDHLARLIVICLFKQILPISAIQRFMRMQVLSYTVDTAYDYVAAELSSALRSAFEPDAPATPDTAHVVTRESLLVRSAVTAFASKAFLMAYLRFSGYEG